MLQLQDRSDSGTTVANVKIKAAQAAADTAVIMAEAACCLSQSDTLLEGSVHTAATKLAGINQQSQGVRRSGPWRLVRVRVVCDGYYSGHQLAGAQLFCTDVISCVAAGPPLASSERLNVRLIVSSTTLRYCTL